MYLAAAMPKAPKSLKPWKTKKPQRVVQSKPQTHAKMKAQKYRKHGSEKF